MAFDAYLSAAEVDELVQAALDAGLPDTPRLLLFAGLPAGYRASFPIIPTPLHQLLADVAKLNTTERLADGTVPLATYLDNAYRQLKLLGLPQASVVADLLSRVRNRAAGTPPLPAPDALPEITKNEQIVAEDDSLDIAFLGRGVEVAKAVARIQIPRFTGSVQLTQADGSPWVMLGTAWLVAPDLALTNHHVINARRQGEPAATADELARQATGATIEFGFDTSDADPVLASVTGLVTASPALDFALLEIAGGPGGPVPRIRSERLAINATSRVAVNIIQHPGGRPKQVALRNNLVTAATDTEVRYFTDTDYGSSGSAVCDDQWRVVALHRGAQHAPNTQYQGRTEAWVNYGSQIQAVLEAVAAADPAAATRIAAAQGGG
jgi:V8-like Glu-specific endopeptidase